MILTNYWWLLIWLFTGGLALAAYFPKHREMVCGKIETRWGVVPAVLMAVPYIVWAGYRSDAFGDTAAYRGAFKDAPSSFSEMSAYLDTIMKDKGFYGLVAALKSLFHVSDIGCFMLLAGFQLLVIVWLYRKYSSFYWFSFFLFIASTDYMSWAQNGVRQFLAVTIALLATPFMLKKKYIPAILLIILASTMHQSALLMIPLMIIAQGKPWNRRTILFLLLALVAILYVGKFTSLLDNAMKETQYANMVNDWTSWGDDGTNPLRVLIYSIPAILSFIGLKYIQEADDPVINLCTNIINTDRIRFLMCHLNNIRLIAALCLFTGLTFSTCLYVFRTILALQAHSKKIRKKPLPRSPFAIQNICMRYCISLNCARNILDYVFVPYYIFKTTHFYHLPCILFHL